jgi:hypothetical protein
MCVRRERRLENPENMITEKRKNPYIFTTQSEMMEIADMCVDGKEE